MRAAYRRVGRFLQRQLVLRDRHRVGRRRRGDPRDRQCRVRPERAARHRQRASARPGQPSRDHFCMMANSSFWIGVFSMRPRCLAVDYSHGRSTSLSANLTSMRPRRLTVDHNAITDELSMVTVASMRPRHLTVDHALFSAIGTSSRFMLQ